MFKLAEIPSFSKYNFSKDQQNQQKSKSILSFLFNSIDLKSKNLKFIFRKNSS